MKIVIIGPGALGCLFAAKLSFGPDTHEVWLLDHNPDRAARLQKGIVLSEGEQQHVCPVQVSHDSRVIGTADLIIICVKSHDVPTALAACSPLLSGRTMVVGLQNGIGHLDHFHHFSNSLIGVTAQGANLVTAGHVRHGGSGMTRIGWLQSRRRESAPLLLVSETLEAAGLPAAISDNIVPHIWEKLLVNVGINALTAIFDCPNGELLQIDAARNKLILAVREGVAVAGGLGIVLPADPRETVFQVCRDTAANISSMLQDVRAHRKTEIDAINGAVVQKARALGLAVPVNQELVAKVKEIEEKYL